MTPLIIAHQPPLSMDFSKQEYWSGLSIPSPGDFPTQGSNPGLPHCRRILYCLSHQGRSILAQLSFRKPLQISTYKEKKLKKWCCCLVTKSCPTLCNSMDCSPLGSSVHGILQARILEWVAIPFTRASSWPRDWTQVCCITGRFFNVWAS